MDLKNERTLEIKNNEHIKLFLKDSISAKHLTLDLFDKVSNSDF